MFKLFICACLFAAVSATHPGYNYQGSASAPAPVAHHTQQTYHAQPAQSHNEGYEKHFYYFNAPEEHIAQHSQPQKKITPTQVKKNLQVIFIKPPESKVHHHHSAPQAPRQVTEDRTHIYVLSKEPNHAAQTKHVQTVQNVAQHHHKPEVHYVKYHTPAEAQHIQQSIIQQYGGKPSEIIHGGSGSSNHGPVSVNFVNTSGKEHHHASTGVSRQYLAPEPAATSVDNNYAKNFLPSGADVVPGSSYIPPAFRF